MVSLLEQQAVKSKESVENCLVGAAFGLFVGRTKGSQMGVEAVVGLELGMVVGVVLRASERGFDWQ